MFYAGINLSMLFIFVLGDLDIIAAWKQYVAQRFNGLINSKNQDAPESCNEMAHTPINMEVFSEPCLKSKADLAGGIPFLHSESFS